MGDNRSVENSNVDINCCLFIFAAIGWVYCWTTMLFMCDEEIFDVGKIAMQQYEVRLVPYVALV